MYRYATIILSLILTLIAAPSCRNFGSLSDSNLVNGGKEESSVASIYGKISDILGEPVSGAEIELSPGGLSGKSGEGGRYSIGLTAAGTYSIGIAAVGYKSAALENISVAEGESKELNVNLRLDPSAAMAKGMVVGEQMSSIHISDFGDPALHGRYYLQNRESCTRACHNRDVSENPNAGRCQNSACHRASYPHPAYEMFRSQHGELSRAGGGACASACHGTDLAGGLSGIGCRDCHLGSGHPEEFIREHGADYTLSQDRCRFCHGGDFMGDGNPAMSCYRCHSVFPHPPLADSLIPGTPRANAVDWHAGHIQGTRARNGSWVANSWQFNVTGIMHDWINSGVGYRIETCTSCHGEDFRGRGVEAKDCLRACHDGNRHQGDERADRFCDEESCREDEVLSAGEFSYCKFCHMSRRPPPP